MIKFSSLAAAGIAAVALAATAMPSKAGFEDSDKDRDARWQELQKQIFNDKQAATDDKAVQLDVAGRAIDAARRKRRPGGHRERHAPHGSRSSALPGA